MDDLRLLRTIMFLILLSMVAKTAQAQDGYEPPGDIYEIGDTEMHLHCTGEGAPTVILEAGVAGFSLNWTVVQPKMAQFTRVCSYDRVGYGWSEPLAGDFDVRQATAQLHELLTIAEVEPPYILVGHSFGGVLVRRYRQVFPDEVVGMVLLDPVHPQLAERVPYYPAALRVQLNGLGLLSGIARERAARTGGSVVPEDSSIPPDVETVYAAKLLEAAFFETSVAEATYLVDELPQLALADDLGELPLVVIAHGIPERNSLLGAPLRPDLAAEAEATWQAMLREQGQLSAVGEYRVAEDSGHNIQLDQPELVVEVVREMIDTHTDAN